MFKVSQEIRLKTANKQSVHISREGNEENSTFGRYKKTPDLDFYPASNETHIYVAPELTDASKVQLLHFPTGAILTNSEVKFYVKRNGIKGNFEVMFESPSGNKSIAPLKFIDPERLEVCYTLMESGLYKVHIKCNSVQLPRSPFIIIAIAGSESEVENIKTEIPMFNSEASKVLHSGLQLHSKLNVRNEFLIDCSKAGNNILFVGILGPKGQCEEVAVKHLGRNIYKVQYQLQEPGEYFLAAKWGEDHIPGSPFGLAAI